MDPEDRSCPEGDAVGRFLRSVSREEKLMGWIIEAHEYAADHHSEKEKRGPRPVAKVMAATSGQ